MSEAIAFQPDFQSYLNAIRKEYERWWEYYTVTDAQGRERRKATELLGQQEASPFDFGLMVQTVAKNDGRRTPNLENSQESPEKPPEKIERLPVLEGLRKYAFDEKTWQLLLVGRPGSGKSTALARLLLEEAKRFSAGTSSTIPVLVELRYWRTSIEDLMLEAFRRHGLELSASQLDRLLNENRLLVLMDGMNELPTEEGRSQLAAFRRRYPRVPAIFTTRDLSLGGDAGIEKKLEMQPLTEPQMQAFVEAYLPEDGEAMWRQLQGRLREFGKTPLLLWMLCEVVKQSPNAQFPTNLAGIFQVFTHSYEVSSVRKHKVAVQKGDTTPLSDRRLWCKALKHLAWVMMRGEKPVDFRVAIRRSEAERELENLFEKEPYPSKIARDCLDDLLKYHLLQIRTGDEIEFRHQLIQEYYAAEALRERLPELSDAELMREYLNYLKWTEPVALMLALVGEEALRVVRLALEVDWMLGARLAGEVKRKFQEDTVGMVSGLDVPLWLKFELWGKTQGDYALEGLVKALEDEDSNVRRSAVEALGNLGSEAALPALLQALEDGDVNIRQGTAKALGKLSFQRAIPGLLQVLEDKNYSVRQSAVTALGNLSSEVVIPALLQVLEDKNYDVRWRAVVALGNCGAEVTTPLLRALTHEDSWIRGRAAEVLGKVGEEVAIPALLQALEDKNYDVRWNAAEALGKLGVKTVISTLLHAIEYEDAWVRGRAAEALGKLSAEVAIPALIQALDDESSFVRMSAAEALGNLNSEEAIPSLLRALEDKNSNVCWNAVAALGKLGSNTAIPALLHALKHEDSWVRWNAAEALGKLDAKIAISVLLQMLADENSDVRRSTVEALGNLGSEVAIPALIQGLDDENSNVRGTAAQALGKLGTEVAIPVLLQAFNDENSWVSRSAAEALGNFENDRAAHILPHLLTLIPTKSGEEAFHALTAIQANCKFYNYDIFRSPPIPKPEAETLSAQTTIYNIPQVGNLNTGDMTIHGNQIGTQNNTEPKTRSDLQ